MARLKKRQVFLNKLLKEIETDPYYSNYREALYKEYLLHLTTNSPRWLYDSIRESTLSYYDYMVKEVNSTLTYDELLTDMMNVLDNPINNRMIETLKTTTVL